MITEEDDYFMGMAIWTAQRSKDPIKKVGACIVNENKQVVGIGYNAFPRGSEDHSWNDDKKLYVVHAEMHAIINKLSDSLKNCTLYVTSFPCNECAKVIIQSHITRIIYLEEANETKQKYKASKNMLDKLKESILCEKYQPNKRSITIDFETQHQPNKSNAENGK